MVPRAHAGEALNVMFSNLNYEFMRLAYIQQQRYIALLGTPLDGIHIHNLPTWSFLIRFIHTNTLEDRKASAHMDSEPSAKAKKKNNKHFPEMLARMQRKNQQE